MSGTKAADMRKLTKLKKSRTGKKIYITKRINQLNGMVEAGGCGRGEMKRLVDKLVVVYEELEKVCDDIMDISLLHDVSDDNLNDVEDIRFNVDSCVALVTEHIESRQDEAPSSGSQRTSSGSMRTIRWVAMLPGASSDALGESEFENLDTGSDTARSVEHSVSLPGIDSTRNAIHVGADDISR